MRLLNTQVTFWLHGLTISNQGLEERLTITIFNFHLFVVIGTFHLFNAIIPPSLKGELEERLLGLERRLEEVKNLTDDHLSMIIFLCFHNIDESYRIGKALLYLY